MVGIPLLLLILLLSFLLFFIVINMPGHAVPTNSNNADGSGGDLWPHALSEIKRSQLQTVGLGAGG